MEDVLMENIRNLCNSSKLVYDSGDYNSAAMLYFKLIFAVADLQILQKTGKIIKDHTDRFKTLKIIDPDFYGKLDRNFRIYRDTYNLKISKEDCDKVKKDAEELIAKQKIQ